MTTSSLTCVSHGETGTLRNKTTGNFATTSLFLIKNFGADRDKSRVSSSASLVKTIESRQASKATNEPTVEQTDQHTELEIIGHHATRKHTEIQVVCH